MQLVRFVYIVRLRAGPVPDRDLAEPDNAASAVCEEFVGSLSRARLAAELLATPGALLTRTHLAELGLGRSAVDAVFRELDVVVFPGSSRPHVRRDDYVELVAQSTYHNGRVRPA